VQDIVLYIYKCSLRLQHVAFDILSWQNARLTITVLLIAVVSLVLSSILGDLLFVWLIVNLIIVYPLLNELHGKELQVIVKAVEGIIDTLIKVLPIIKGIENKRKSTITSGGESKKDK
jgi:hypothetical protein